eukprot:gene12755-14062_t
MAESQLLQAARDGEVDQLKTLLAEGTKQIANNDGDTPLHLATSCYVTEPKYVEVVRQLLENGADFNAANKIGDSPVHNAASLGNFGIIEVLIEYGCNLEVIDAAGMTPLGVAALKKHHAVVNLIVDHLLEADKVTEIQFAWMFGATDANQQLTIYRSLSSIAQNKTIFAKLIPLKLIDAICHGLTSFDKKGVQTHALQLLHVIVKTPEGLKAAKESSVASIIRDVIDKNEEDAVIKHLALFIKAMSVFGHRVDPESHMTVPEIIIHNGYPVEEHFVTTEDGYILGLHRIPGGRNEKAPSNTSHAKPVAFLQHGLLCSSADWVVNLRNESLGFLLADAGFDVWLGNSRGNTYSRKHVSLPVASDAFWKFSWDEMASKDLPAVINHVKKTTKQEQMYYVGHSQGTMIAFAEFSSNQVVAKSIKKFFALGPVAFLGNMKSPLKYLADIVPELKLLFKILGVRDFMPQSWLIKWLASHICTLSLGETACEDIIFILCGFDKAQMNATRLDVYTTHSPAGTSVQNMIHYAQAYKSKKFMKYDFGKDGNIEKYGQATPPEYNLANFNVDTVMYSAGNDWLADPRDVTRLVAGLKKNILDKHKEIEPWMHLDFIWGMDATELVYNEIIKDMKAGLRSEARRV